MTTYKGSPVYLSDLKKEYQQPGFIGEGITALKERAEKEGKRVIVGYYLHGVSGEVEE